MANVQYTENLTEEQLDAMAGSETLRYQATSFGVTRNNKVGEMVVKWKFELASKGENMSIVQILYAS